MIPLEWKLIAGAVAAITLGVLFALYRHSLIMEGERKVLEANARQAAALQRQADQITRTWAAKAEEAEHRHDQELTDLRAYRLAHPIVGASELCKPAPGSQGHLPSTAADNGRHDGGAPSSPVGEPMHPGNSGVAANRIQMLDDFAAVFDAANARLREWQDRERSIGTVAQ